MKRILALGLIGSVLLPVHGQDPAVDLDGLVQAGQQLVRQQLDAQGLQLAVPIDEEQVRAWLKELQTRFAGEYVLDLARLRPAAEAALPFLDASEELQPYSKWLRTRLDYLKAADELELLIPGALPPKPGVPAPPRARPTPEQQRRVWSKVVALEPWPESANRFVPRLKPLFTAERVPAELVWLAEVESSFQPGARSPAGAAGLFQLMPQTARQEGLSLWPLDQRYDPDKSARASARYLKTLHTEFKDWSLALAAYNSGDGHVRTLMKRHSVRSYDRLAPYLPAETQLYVPKVEAVIRRREGKALAQLAVAK